MYYISEPLVVEQPEANKSSAADEPENKEKESWMQVREAIAARSRALFGASYVM
jgi:hypothetical protein